jgi:hypothetical protein
MAKFRGFAPEPKLVPLIWLEFIDPPKFDPLCPNFPFSPLQFPYWVPFAKTFRKFESVWLNKSVGFIEDFDLKLILEFCWLESRPEFGPSVPIKSAIKSDCLLRDRRFIAGGWPVKLVAGFFLKAD